MDHSISNVGSPPIARSSITSASDRRMLKLGRRRANTKGGSFSGRQMGGQMIVPAPLIAVAAVIASIAGWLNPLLAVVILLLAAAMAAIGTVVMRFQAVNVRAQCEKGVEIWHGFAALSSPKSSGSFVAICRCGWTGGEQDSLDGAERQAVKHARGAPVSVHAHAAR